MAHSALIISMPNRLARSARAAREIELPQRYRLIVDTIPHMVWAARPDGWLEFANARTLDYTGAAFPALEGRGWQSAVHPDDLERCLERWSTALRSGRPYRIEYRLKRHDGAYLWHLGAAMPWRGVSERIQRWFGTWTDIEIQKKAERQLESARRALEALVATRTHALEKSRNLQGTLVEASPDADYPLERLSAREREVLQLIVKGHTSAAVAAALELSPKSVDTYRSRLMAKLKIDDMPTLVKFAIRHGVTSVE